MIIPKPALWIIGALFLGACTSENGGVETSLIAGARDVLRARLAPDRTEAAKTPENFDIGTSVTPAQIEALSVPTIVGYIPARDAWSTLTMVARNGPFSTYFTPDSIGVTIREGVVVSTRGITGDLHASSGAPTIAALSSEGAGGEYSRVLRYLTPTSQLEALRFACSMKIAGQQSVTIAQTRYSTRVFEESCASDTDEFTNRYWKTASTGQIVRSRQWISPEIGYLDLFVLRK